MEDQERVKASATLLQIIKVDEEQRKVVLKESTVAVVTGPSVDTAGVHGSRLNRVSRQAWKHSLVRQRVSPTTDQRESRGVGGFVSTSAGSLYGKRSVGYGTLIRLLKPVEALTPYSLRQEEHGPEDKVALFT